MNLKKIKSLAFLAMGLVQHFFLSLFHINRRHKKEFLASYRDDRIFPVSPTFRDMLPDFSRCLYCFRCDAHCPENNGSNSAFMPPSFIVGSFSRSLTDFCYDFTGATCEQCRVCESVCPQSIPIRQILSFIKQEKKNLQAAG
ncbi:MAG: hypothetical protein HQM16_00660 [Deltaproteobacteria bacterium]|nr:hypothetical protein [Deltaproteobacteria bacterium]